MPDMHIRQALALMDTYEIDGTPQTFSIVFVKTNGQLRSLSHCAKGHKTAAVGETGRGFGYNHKESGTVLIRDIEANRSISIKISGIIIFNGHTVRH